MRWEVGHVYQLRVTGRPLPFTEEAWLVWGSGKQVAKLDFEAKPL